MKLLVLFIILLGTSYADIIDLGTLDSGDQFLDQRFTQTSSEQDRLNSLGTFYSDRELDFLKDIQSQHETQFINPDEEWGKLLEGHL